MEHPFFKNRKLLIIYASIWFSVACIHFIVLYYFYQITLAPSFFDSLLFNLMFCLFGVSVWYVIRFQGSGKSPVFNAFINHITIIAVYLTVWLGLGQNILSHVFSGDDFYLRFLKNSIPWRVVSGLLFYFIMVLIFYVILYYNDLQEKNIREARLNEILRAAELNLLKSQINPHFLFNSLNSVSSLTMTDPSKAQEMIIKLSDFLRYCITPKEKNLSDLVAEISNSKRYLDIEQVRFGSKLVSEFDIPEQCNKATIPAMILQPLYENAVKHGVYESSEPIMIKTICRIDNHFLSVVIMNNFDPHSHSPKGAGIGLRNIIERLKLLYGNDQLLKTERKDCIFTANLLIPQK